MAERKGRQDRSGHGKRQIVRERRCILAGALAGGKERPTR